MHKNLLPHHAMTTYGARLCTKSTTRIILEHISTNIVDGSKFHMPHDEHWLWLLQYVVPKRNMQRPALRFDDQRGHDQQSRFVDLIRNLLIVTSQKGGTITQYLLLSSLGMKNGPECTTLRLSTSGKRQLRACSVKAPLQLHQQALRDPACAGVSSRVEVDSRSSRWVLGICSSCPPNSSV